VDGDAMLLMLMDELLIEVADWMIQLLPLLLVVVDEGLH